MLKALDLFSGIGGMSLGLGRSGIETVAFCEIDKFCQRVLKKHWPDVPIYEDVRSLDGGKFRESVDIICGGYPCQPFSTAGKREGRNDDRHLWPEFARIIDEVKPKYVIGENVAGHINLGLDDVLSDLDKLGYSTETFVIPACAVGRDHWRQRVWVLAHTMQGERQMGRHITGGRGKPKQISWHGMGKEKTTPRVVGGFNGIPYGLDRIRALGNAVVPYIPELIGRAILEVEAVGSRTNP